jgi:HK97 gp10 family phage protein
MSQLKLKGAQETLAFLNAFPERLRKGAVRAALTAAARPIRDQARLNAPRDSGALAAAIKTGSSSVNPDGTVSIKVRLRGRHSFLGLFFEYGVRPHLIAVSDAEVPRYKTRSGLERKRSIGFVNQAVRAGSLVIGREFIGPVVQHPGFAARPFLRPALDNKADEAIRAFGVRLSGYLKDKSGFTAPVPLEVEE